MKRSNITYDMNDFINHISFNDPLYISTDKKIISSCPVNNNTTFLCDLDKINKCLNNVGVKWIR